MDRSWKGRGEDPEAPGTEGDALAPGRRTLLSGPSKQPATIPGRRTLTMGLAVQLKADGAADDSPLEQEADAVGHRVALGGVAPSISHGSPLVIGRQAANAPHAVAVNAAVAASLAGPEPVILDEGGAIPGPHQILKRDFLTKIEAALKAAASAELGPLWSIAGCPYIAHYLQIYAARPARDGEMFVRRYTGSAAIDAQQLMLDLVTRARLGIRYFKETKKPPPDLAAADPIAASTVAAAGTPGANVAPADAHAGPALQRKAQHGDRGRSGSPAAVLERLGEGEPLDSATASRMAQAFGTSFSDVRIHADETGGALAREQYAHAFTIGTHVAFAPGKYAPGTVEGDALLAHELTHVLQQRGAAAAAPQKKSASGGATEGAEQDADRGAAAAVAQLHGAGPAKAEKAEAKVSSDLQLQRCEGTLNEGEDAMLARERGFHNQTYTWNGDPFVIRLRYSLGGKDFKEPVGVELTAKYAGNDDPSTADITTSLIIPYGKQPTPKVMTDRPDGWSTITVDLYGDASWLGTFTHETDLLDGWNPRSRDHHFGGKGAANNAGDYHIIVKSKDSLPGTATNTVAQGVGEDTRALRIDVAAASTKHWLDELLADPACGLNQQAAPWAMLKKKVDADAAKYTANQHVAGDEALRLSRLGEVLESVRPSLRALGVASKPEGYLPDIAGDAIAMIAGVRNLYEDAIAASWDGPPGEKLVAAEKEFNTVWYRVSALYLERGRGVEHMTTEAWEIAQQAGDLRQGRAPHYAALEEALGVGGGGHGKTDLQVTKDQVDRVRDDFMAGKTGSLAQITKLVEDTQLYTGLASLLCTSGVFFDFKQKLDGIVGGAADHIGRNLTKVCRDYISQFESLAAGVEASVSKTQDLHVAGPNAVAKFQAIVTSDKFKKDVDAIQSRVKTVKVIETLGKVLAIVGVAALTGGAAGAAVGGALEGAGATAGAVATGEFAAEVVTFTVASRIGNEAVFGKNENSLGEDLLTNALMFGFLKAASEAYGRVFKVFADPRVYKTTFAVGGALTGMVALQAFAEIQFRIKQHRWMDGDERLQGLMSNAVMVAALALGSYLAKPLNTRIRRDMLVFTAKNVPGRLEAIEGQIAGIKGEVDALKGAKGQPGAADRAAELLGRIEKLWNEEVSVLAEAAKKEKENRPAANKAFQETVAEFVKQIAKLDLQLASAGLDVDLGATKAGNFFKPISPGFVAFRPEGLEILQDFYKENGGTFGPVPGKDGMYSGKAGGDETFYVTGDKAESFFDKPSPKPPTEKQAAANRAEAAKARVQNNERGKELRNVLVAKAKDGHVLYKLGRIVEGTGLAAAMDANTLPGASKGEHPPPITSIPSTIGVGTGLDTFSKLGDTPIGQDAEELASDGWAEGAAPGDMTADHGSYASATTIADARALTQYRSGVAILDAAILEVSIKPDATWKVSDAKVRVKVKLVDGPELFLYSDATDIATGLGAPRELETDKINGDPQKARQYQRELESSHRLVYGDEPGVQRGGKVLVSGGSATAAWNATIARGLGAIVDWFAPDISPGRKPSSEIGTRDYKEIEDKLARGEISPEEANKKMAELRAFDAAKLPRNLQRANDAFNDAGIHRASKSITSMTPAEAVGGDAGKVRVTFSDGTSGEYDQVVISHGTNLANSAGTGPAGALTLAKGMQLRPVIVDGQVVALETIDPPGAVRVLGAAMWSPRWIDYIPRDAIVDGQSARALYQTALEHQAESAPRDSPLSPLVHNVGKRIPAANTKLGG